MVVDARHVTHLGFDAEFRIGFGTHGEVVVAERNSNKLHKYQMQPGGTYVNTWNMDLPQNSSSFCRIIVSTTGTLLLQDVESSPTVILSPDGNQILETQYHKGRLIACKPPTRPVYKVNNGDKGYELAVAEEDGSEYRLQSETGHVKSYQLSVCQDKHGRTVMVDGDKQTLDIFSQQCKSHIYSTHSHHYTHRKQRFIFLHLFTVLFS